MVKIMVGTDRRRCTLSLQPREVRCLSSRPLFVGFVVALYDGVFIGFVGAVFVSVECVGGVTMLDENRRHPCAKLSDQPLQDDIQFNVKDLHRPKGIFPP